MSWLSDDYLFRRKLTIASAPQLLPIGHPVEVELPLSIFDSGKLRGDHADLEIVYVAGDGQMTALYREVVRDNLSIKVTFAVKEETIEDITPLGSYYVQYGNPNLLNTPTRETTPYLPWPVSYGRDEGDITYTRPGEHWNSGVSEVAGARANLLTYAKSLRVVYVGKTGYGIVLSQLNDLPTNQIDLNVEYSDAETEVYDEYTDLDLTQHELKIENAGFNDSLESSFTIELDRVDVVLPAELQSQNEELNSSIWGNTSV